MIRYYSYLHLQDIEFKFKIVLFLNCIVIYNKNAFKIYINIIYAIYIILIHNINYSDINYKNILIIVFS